MKKQPSKILLAALIAGLPALASASCGSAYCTVNSNWTTQSAAAEAGTAYDLRYEYIDQADIYQGGTHIPFGQVHQHHDEISTTNRNLLASISHNFANGWGVTVSLPVGERDHLHAHNHHGAVITEQWRFTELGDVRVTGRFQVASAADPLAPTVSGVSVGLKLPTGKTNVKNAAGSEAERSLQPGTGTTDLALGAYHHQRLTAQDASWFVQAQYQHALGSHSGFKPGDSCGLDAGVRKGVSENVGLLLQLNFVHKRPDSGSEAEPDSSGGRFVHASPGVSYTLNGSTQLYAFYQHPLLRHVNGVQLTASKSIVAGIGGRF